MVRPLRRLVVLSALICACASAPPPSPSPSPVVAEKRPEPVAPALETPKPPAAPKRVFENPLVEPRETRAMVLVYHEFNRGSEKLSVRTRDFEEQLDWLENNGVEVVSVSELLDFLDKKRRLPAKVAVITIDDAWKSVYTHAWPILKRRGVRFTIGVPTGMLEDPKNAPVMTWDEVRELCASGLAEVASHGHMHRALSHLSGRWLKEELELSRDLIQERLGVRPVAYFYPLGAFNATAGKRVKAAGYRAAFRATGAPIFLGSGSRWWLPRMGVFHGDGAWMVAQFFSKKRLARVSP